MTKRKKKNRSFAKESLRSPMLKDVFLEGRRTKKRNGKYLDKENNHRCMNINNNAPQGFFKKDT